LKLTQPRWWRMWYTIKLNNFSTFPYAS